MKRREARELCMQMLFQMDAQKDFRPEQKEQFLSMYVEDKSQQEYFEKMQQVLSEHREEMDARLEAASDNWKLNRVSKVDLAILRLALAEILYFDEIPGPVSVNEAVEMAKKYGGDDSPKFVNGLLGRIMKGSSDGSLDSGN